MKNKDYLLFYQELKTFFPNIGFEEGRFLKDIKLQLRDFSLMNPDCSYKKLTDTFGTPQELYNAYIQSQEVQASYTKSKPKKHMKAFCLCCISILLLIFLVTMLFHYKAYKYFTEHTATNSETIIEEGTTYYE